MTSPLLSQANESNIKLIRDLAVKIWHQHYPAIITVEQIDYMLEKMYSENSLKIQMAEGHMFFIIEPEKPSGFLSIRNEKNSEFFLSKFYIDQNVAGKGLGTRVFKQILAILQPGLITLTVNRQNYTSINFYFKNGFVIDRVEDFDIGKGFVMNDFVMTWKRS